MALNWLNKKNCLYFFIGIILTFSCSIISHHKLPPVFQTRTVYNSYFFLTIMYTVYLYTNHYSADQLNKCTIITISCIYNHIILYSYKFIPSGATVNVILTP